MKTRKPKRAPKKRRKKPGPVAARVKINDLDAALDSLLGKKTKG